MELKEIQTLIKFISDSGVDEVDLEKKDFKLSIRKLAKSSPVVTSAVIHPATPVAQQVNSQPAQVTSPVATTPVHEETKNTITIKSPMIGTFYRSQSPEKPSFVNEGDTIKPGKVVCIIEAMKLFNEIESEVSGRIVKILVENATPVEYDQPLFVVEPA